MRSPEGTVQSGPYLLISEFYSYASGVLCMPLQWQRVHHPINKCPIRVSTGWMVFVQWKSRKTISMSRVSSPNCIGRNAFSILAGILQWFYHDGSEIGSIWENLRCINHAWRIFYAIKVYWEPKMLLLRSCTWVKHQLHRTSLGNNRPGDTAEISVLIRLIWYFYDIKVDIVGH